MATGPSPPRSSGSREPWAFWGAFLALSATSLLLIWRYPFAPIADGPLLAYTSVVMTDLVGGGGVSKKTQIGVSTVNINP